MRASCLRTVGREIPLGLVVHSTDTSVEKGRTRMIFQEVMDMTYELAAQQSRQNPREEAPGYTGVMDDLPAPNLDMSVEADVLRVREYVEAVATDEELIEVVDLVYGGLRIREATVQVLGARPKLLPAPGTGDGTSDSKRSEGSREDGDGAWTLDIA